jgi:hypothetical protein
MVRNVPGKPRGQIDQIFLVRVAGCGAIAVSLRPAEADLPGGSDIDIAAGEGKPAHKKLRRRARNVVSRRRLTLGP